MKERQREKKEGEGARDRGTRKKTKKRSAPHESLIESIHGDSGGEKKSPVPRYEWQAEARESVPGRYNERWLAQAYA